MSALFRPFALGDVVLANRIVVSPMCQYVAEDGRATDWHVAHYGGLAQSGAGLLIVEATAVEPDGRITPGDLGLWDDATEAALANIVAAVRRHSTVRLGLQLSHAGRKASSRVPWEGGAQIASADGGWPADAPSTVPHRDGEEPPRGLDRSGIERVVRAFSEAARRARRLGFDVVEVHAAHGYLLHQFLSPLANYRDDEYGGTPEARMRMPLAVLAAVREAFPGPIGVKVSVSDWTAGGLDLDQSIGIAAALRDGGAAWITASSGGVSSAQRIEIRPGYQLPFAAGIRRAVSVPTLAVGLVTEPAQAEAVVADGTADLVALARGMLWNPRWGWYAAAALGGRVDAAPPYWRAPPNGAEVFTRSVHGAR
ncbi:MAG: NADH:flavin oxidoreductase/NADH oxidase [Gluconacetobacter diazotrophicus]|nr:NADH:flavin oxidoreductase/NADH oxidase [Gluconacetobacter diazotrophicus]